MTLVVCGGVGLLPAAFGRLAPRGRPPAVDRPCGATSLFAVTAGAVLVDRRRRALSASGKVAARLDEFKAANGDRRPAPAASELQQQRPLPSGSARSKSSTPTR